MNTKLTLRVEESTVTKAKDEARRRGSAIEEALAGKVADFEDAGLEKAGALAGVEAIVTRNTRDFRKASIRAVDPVEFLASLPG